MSKDKLKLRNNKPTLASAIAAFLASLVAWGVDLMPESIPDEVVTSGQALVLALVAVVVGQLTQYLGRNAPWSVDMHKAAVAYALTKNTDGAEVEDALGALGFESADEARAYVGLDPRQS